MFTLVSGAYRYFTRLDEYNVLILGPDGAGKTALLERIKSIYTGASGIPMEKIQPTVGVNIGKVHLRRVLVKFMDLGGEKELRRIWEAYFGDCHAVLFVLDSSLDRVDGKGKGRGMGEVRDVLLKLVQAPELAGLPLMVLANKQDLGGDADAESSLALVKEMVNGLADYMDGRHVRVVGSSAADGHGVRGAVDWLCTRMIENRAIRPPMVSDV
ncbi:ADP-ribosylation factor protein 3 [Coemansia sp. RSA 1285]|nr:ADP-ribosylation factor protein 3 [Coemansia sp. RSA 1285]